MSFTIRSIGLEDSLNSWIGKVEGFEEVDSSEMRLQLRDVSDLPFETVSKMLDEIVPLTAQWDYRVVSVGIQVSPSTSLINKKVQQLMLNELAQALSHWLDIVQKTGVNVTVPREGLGLLRSMTITQKRREAKILEVIKQKWRPFLGGYCDDSNLAAIVNGRVINLGNWYERIAFWKAVRK